MVNYGKIPKISPSKRAFEKYKNRGLFSEFYGMSRFEINNWVRKKIKQMSGGETCPRMKTSAKQISFGV